MIGNDLLNVRTALLITLSILVIVLLWRRLKRHVLANDMPAILHVEVLGLQPAYHPARLFVEIYAPEKVSMGMRVLDEQHKEVQLWPSVSVDSGNHMLEQQLIDLVDGLYFLELTSPTQRTVRQFRLQLV